MPGATRGDYIGWTLERTKVNGSAAGPWWWVADATAATAALTPAQRRAAMEARGDAAWLPVDRERYVSQALQAYAALTTSADRGAVRDLSQLKR